MKRIAIFLCVCLLGAAIAWLAGFNFDQRNDNVAMGTLITLAIAGLFAFLCAHPGR